jgi:hypothetical protein
MIVERHSIVDVPPERVWARVVTPVGINDELRPWMTMSMPRGKESLTVDNIPVGTPVGRCWMRLLTPVVAAGIGALFGHRQRRLQRHFRRR